MANRYAVASGNWSNTATWDGGTLPAPGDVVRPNGFTVTIDQDITVDELRDNALAPAVQGGFFSVNSNNRTLICNIFKSHSFPTPFITITSNADNTTIIGNILITSSSGSGAIAVRILSTGTTNIISNIEQNSPQAAQIGVQCHAASGTVNITGELRSFGSNALFSSAAVTLSNNMTINFNGIIFGNSTSVAPTFANSSVGGVLTGSVNVIGGTRAPAVSNTGLSQNIVINSVTFADGQSPISGAVRFSPVAPTVTIILSDLSTLTLTDPSQTDPPAESDVKENVNYGGGAFTGTLKVPDPADVRKGVDVDDTVGTGIITGDDFFDLIKTSSDPVAERLRNVATVATVGDQFNGFQ